MVVFSSLFFRDIFIHSYYFVASIGLTIISISIFRYVVIRLGALGLVKTRIVVLGAGERASIIEKKMRRASDRRGFDLLGFIPVPGDNVEHGIQNEPILNINIDDSFKSFILENEIDEKTLLKGGFRSLGQLNGIRYLDFNVARFLKRA